MGLPDLLIACADKSFMQPSQKMQQRSVLFADCRRSSLEMFLIHDYLQAIRRMIGRRLE
jgi:hypothetical protein